MKPYLRLPNAGELTYWTFAKRDGNIVLVLRLHNVAQAIRKSTRIPLPDGYYIKYHEIIKDFVAYGEDKEVASQLTTLLQSITSRLQIGMNKGEWERALPEIWSRLASLTVSGSLDRYFKARMTGNEYYPKGSPATLKGIRFAKSAWDKFGQDMDIFRLTHSANVDKDAKKELELILRKFLAWMKTTRLQPSSQKLYFYHIKSAINCAKQEFDLFIPEKVDKLQISAKAPDIMTIDDQGALKALAELPIMGQKGYIQEAVLCSRIMLAFGLRIGDAVGLTLNNFRETDQGHVLRVISKKNKVVGNYPVPESLWREILFCFRQWEGKLVYRDTSHEGNTARIRSRMVKLVSQLPGMDTKFQKTVQLPDGTTEIVWTTMGQEFRPHILRKTAGSAIHALNGRGHDFLGNGEGIFKSRYLNQEAIDLDTQRKYHVSLGLVEDGVED